MYARTKIEFNHSKRLQGEIRKNASRIVRKTAFDVLAFMASICAVDTGNLKNSLAPGGPHNIFEILPGGLVAIIGTAVEYAGFVNYGTVHMAAQPFLEPAVEAHRAPFQAAMTHLLEAA